MQGHAGRRLSITWTAAFLLVVLAILSAICAFGWMTTWHSLSLPAMYPPFADIGVIQGAVASLSSGFDPQIGNPEDHWGRLYNYPWIWIDIARFLGISNEANLLTFGCALVAGFVVSGASLLFRYPSCALFLTLTSGAAMLAAERGNLDLLMFGIVYLTTLLSEPWVVVLLLLLATVLKVYPVFAVPQIGPRLFPLAALAIVSAMLAWIYFGELEAIRATTPQIYWLSYGAETMHLFLRARFAVDVPTAVLLLLHLLVIGGVVYKNWLDRGTEDGGETTAKQKLFLAGGGIYLATYFLSTNFDYRMIFLALCIPYFMDVRLVWIKRLVLFCIIISCNAVLFTMLFRNGGTAVTILTESIVFILVGSGMVHELATWGAVFQKSFRNARA